MTEMSSMSHLLDEKRKFYPPPELERTANLNREQYERMYRRSIEDRDAFWLEQADGLQWFKSPKIACSYIWDTKNMEVHHRWFEDGIINVSSNCLDRHLASQRKNKIAIIW